MQSLRNIFNIALKNRLVDLKDHYIMNIRTSHSNFDHANYLTEDGAKAYWSSLDEQIEVFDNNNETLKPIKQDVKIKKHINDSSADQFRLPPPPLQGNNSRPSHRSQHPHAKRHIKF